MDIISGSTAGYAVVRVAGLLDLPAAADLRDALLKAAADQPSAVVCDLDDAVADPRALTVLLVVADQVRAWPACPLAVLAHDPRMRAMLRRVGVDRRAQVMGDLRELVPAVPAAAAASGARLHLTASRRGSGQARSFLRAVVSRTPHTAARVDLGAAELVLTELVTNAVLHAGTDIDVLVNLRGDALRVAVGDGDARVLAVRRAHADDEDGRGLALVDALTWRWGAFPRRPAGKVVWAVLRVSPARAVGGRAALASEGAGDAAPRAS